MRIDAGPGYRLYFTRKSKQLIGMLAGGDKSSQQPDIRRAQRLATELEL
jgi:putative addiction module killer protein